MKICSRACSEHKDCEVDIGSYGRQCHREIVVGWIEMIEEFYEKNPEVKKRIEELVPKILR